jgi:hypothetical protein
MMDMALVVSSIYSCIGQDLKSLANVHDTDFLLRCIMTHRIEALLELQHRDARLGDWLLLQMKVCDEWFEEMETLLSCLRHSGTIKDSDRSKAYGISGSGFSGMGLILFLQICGSH